uniref:ribonucleoside-diphosphate reductase n=1 Tax=viral metagenome TaxID=1070528 RepID=A0A6C0JWH1_9ZZZZ
MKEFKLMSVSVSMSYEQMQVLKRNGEKEDMSFDKILLRIKTLCETRLPVLNIGYANLVMKIINQLIPDMPTSTIDEIVGEQCASMTTIQYDYGELASRIIISNHHKNTNSSFVEVIKQLHAVRRDTTSTPLISDELLHISIKYSKRIEEAIVYDRDYDIDYFGFKTLERSYLLHINHKVVERIQHMWMRVSIGIHGEDITRAIETYHLMSQKYFTHATPTLFNAGTPRPQLSSCFLIGMEEDSIDGIFNTLKECAQISKWAGGIGLHIHNVRASGTRISGTNGVSNGLTPMLQVFNSTARYVDQGGGKRNGSIAIYIEPWHPDIMDVLELKKNHGDESKRARDLFYGLWIPDLFMECVQKDMDWYLMCPSVSVGLSDVYGEEFQLKYNAYVSDGKYVKKIKARELWFKILDSQMETGVPYLCYKDASNRKSNQQNLGTIKSSNLCTEIIQYSDSEQSAVCNLASIGLPKFVSDDGVFNYSKLHEVTQVITYNLNRIIDVNYYPNLKSKRSNLLHRPIGIGVQGLADVFIKMNIPFCSDKAKEVNRFIFETIYHASVECSCNLAKLRTEDMSILMEVHHNNPLFDPSDFDLDSRDYIHTSPGRDLLLKRTLPILAEIHQCRAGGPPGAYSSFQNSPLSKGLFQFDLWNVTPSTRYDWDTLRKEVIQYGVRNSLLVAPMPTASTSQILGYNECFEPYTSNIYSRRTLAGEFIVVNKYLIKEFTTLGLWNEELKNNIIANKGSIQHIEGITDALKEKYKIVWEMKMRDIIDMSADRGAFICQSQSLNLWCEEPSYSTLTSMHFYAWQKGLKTGMYYLRRKPRHQPQQFTVNPSFHTVEESIVCVSCSA